MSVRVQYDEQEFVPILKMLTREKVENFLKREPSVLVIREASQAAKQSSLENGLEDVVAVVSTKMSDGTMKHTCYTGEDLKTRDLYKDFPHTTSIQDNIINPSYQPINYLQYDQTAESIGLKDNMLYKRYNCGGESKVGEVNK